MATKSSPNAHAYNKCRDVVDKWHWQTRGEEVLNFLQSGYLKACLSLLGLRLQDGNELEINNSVSSEASAWRYAQLEYPDKFGECPNIYKPSFTLNEQAYLQSNCKAIYNQALEYINS